MVPDVEGLVVHPDRSAASQRGPDQALSQAGNRTDPPLDHGRHDGRVQGGVGFQEKDGRHVGRHGAAVHRQERAVTRAGPVDGSHGYSRPPRSGRHQGRRSRRDGPGQHHLVGIGRATAIRFAEEGARVVASDVDAEGLADTLKAVVDAGHDAEAIRADITVQADVERIVAEIGERIDVLVNNAGIMDHFVPVTELDDSTWDRVIAVNLTGAMRLCRAVLPAMRQAGRGSVVNVASIGGLTGAVAGTAYVSSKHGVIGLTRSVAALYAEDGVRCNAVCPGGVETNIGVSAVPTVEWA